MNGISSILILCMFTSSGFIICYWTRENEVADRNFKLSEKCDWKNDVDQVTKKIQE